MIERKPPQPAARAATIAGEISPMIARRLQRPAAKVARTVMAVVAAAN